MTAKVWLPMDYWEVTIKIDIWKFWLKDGDELFIVLYYVLLN